MDQNYCQCVCALISVALLLPPTLESIFSARFHKPEFPQEVCT